MSQLKGKLTSKGTLHGHLSVGKIAEDYEKLKNLPLVNGVTLIGDKTTEDLGIAIPQISDGEIADNKLWSSEKISDEIIAILPTGTEDGVIVSFNTSLPMPLVDITVDSSATKVYQRGINLWDESWETGDYDGSGNKRVYSTRTRCKDHIPVAPNTTYRFYMGATSGLAWQFYDENHTFISQQGRAQGSGGFDLTTPANCHYLTFGTWDGYGGTYMNDISINYPYQGTNRYYAYNPNSSEYDVTDISNIVTFSGANNLFTDNGNISVTYKESINDAIASLQALILS